MMNINLHYSVDTLDTLPEKYQGYCRPSAGIYYGRYAYKASFVVPDTPSHVLMDMYGCDSPAEQTRYFKKQLFDYCAIPRSSDQSNKPDYLEENIIFKRTSGDLLTLYFKSKNDLTNVVDHFFDNLAVIVGPLSKTHLDLLESKNYRCEVRTSKWYRKYDYKVYMFMPYRSTLNMTKHDKLAKNNEIINFLKENIPAENLKVYSNGSFPGNVQFFTTSEQFDPVYPFLNMMYNEWRVIVTKAYII